MENNLETATEADVGYLLDLIDELENRLEKVEGPNNG
jgi:hypothetical protein